MEATWTILTVEEANRTTRIMIGCPNQAADIERRLHALGYNVTSATGEMMERSVEECKYVMDLIEEAFVRID